MQTEFAQRRVLSQDMPVAHRVAQPGLRRAVEALVPTPDIAEPERRQECELGGFRTAIGYCYADQDVVDILLGVLDKDIEVAALIENPSVFQLEFRILARARRRSLRTSRLYGKAACGYL